MTQFNTLILLQSIKYGLIAACLLMLLSWSDVAVSRQSGDACQVNARGDYLRADGQARRRWSVKDPDQPIVYVESCLLDQLLSYFPESMRRKGLAVSYENDPLGQPAAWRTAAGESILTLSPASRLQVAAAILYVESEFNPNVGPSSAGAIGPFQVMPATGNQLGMPRVGKQSENFKAGLKYILYIEEQIARHCDFEQRSKETSGQYRDLIAASYHAGPNYLSRADDAGNTCRLDAFPEVTRTEYLARFNRAMTYRFLPARLQYSPR